MDVHVFRSAIDVSLSIPSLDLLGLMDMPHQSLGGVFNWAMKVSVLVVPAWTSLVPRTRFTSPMDVRVFHSAIDVSVSRT